MSSLTTPKVNNISQVKEYISQGIKDKLDNKIRIKNIIIFILIIFLLSLTGIILWLTIDFSKTQECNIEQLSGETNGFREINGYPVPGTLSPLVNSSIILDTKIQDGNFFRATGGIRKSGSRVGIHIHRYGGYTLILKGEMTDFVQGLENKKFGPGTGYYMPPCTPMAAANLGEEDVELIDIFLGPEGKPFIEILEPKWNFERIGKF